MYLFHGQFHAMSGVALTALAGLLPADLAAQTDYNPELLKVKTCFAEREIRSLNEPLVGFATHHQ